MFKGGHFDHRRIKHRIRSMLGFKSPACAATNLPGVEMVQMMRKRQRGTPTIQPFAQGTVRRDYQLNWAHR